MKVDAFFHAYPVFRLEEFVSWKKQHGTYGLKAIRKSLEYYKKQGRIINVRRELYAVVPPTEKPETQIVDPFLIAGKADSTSILAYHTALELHGLAYSIFNQFTFLTEKKNKSFQFQHQSFQPVAIPLVLKNKEKAMLAMGVQEINRQGVVIKVTNQARTFVDVLDRVMLSGGWEEVIRSISQIAVLNIEEVINYCVMFNNRMLAAKVGYWLEQRQGAFSVGQESLKPLLALKPLSPQYVTAPKKTIEPCRLVKKWNLIIPVSILNQSWDEINNDF